MKTVNTFLHEHATSDDFDEINQEVHESIPVSRVHIYMIQFAEACMKEDRKRIKSYMELYKEANPEHAPGLIFND